MSIERIPKAVRLAVPNSMTLARPILGQIALHEARRGNWKRVRGLLGVAMATDLEGNPARWLHATSEGGAKADPVADGALRAQALIAFAPHMNPVVTTLVTAIELDNLRLNRTIQQGEKKPVIPPGAKWGSVLEAAGAAVFVEGMNDDSKMLCLAGQLAILTGAIFRNSSYQTLFNKRNNPSIQR